MPNGNRYILILAHNAQEAAMYGRRAGLPNFTYRAVANRSSIKNIQVADVHILPNFHNRVDKHAILAELKWGRDIRYFDVEMPDAPVSDEGDGMGEQTSLFTVEELLEHLAAPTPAHALGKDPKKHKSVDPVIEIVSSPAAAGSPVHVDAEQAPAAEQAGEETIPAEGKIKTGDAKRRTRCKACGRLVTGPEDPAHDAAAHEEVF